MKNSLYYKVRTDLSVNNLEILWVEIRNSNNEKFLVGVIYRPPNSNLHIWELLCESVDKALDSDLPLFLVGDYNYVTEYGTALTTILPILFLYLNTVIVTAGTFEP